MMVFVDGENLVRGYERVLAARSHVEHGHKVHSPRNYIWVANPFQEFIIPFDVIRASYYFSLVGNDDVQRQASLEALRECDLGSQTIGNQRMKLTPRIYQRPSGGESSKRLDIEICTDVLSNTYQDNFDVLLLVTGDEDFVPLVAEVQRSGKQVVIASFQHGLSPQLRQVADVFLPLEATMFLRPVNGDGDAVTS
ncbi:MAG: NYN domain-containing protein [Gemmatimonadetes bacterium]|nr:NYN domain-containing protein [Gemmatimonadota bacterium]